MAKRHRVALTPHHSHEEVGDDRESERLLAACLNISAPRGVEARFICLLGGGLGLRAGEIAPFKTAWMDGNRRPVQIPPHEPCDWGNCRRQAPQEAPHTDELTPETGLSTRRHPEIVASARSSPFDLSLRIELCIERVTNWEDPFPRSRSTIDRRIKQAADKRDSPAPGIPTVCGRAPPARGQAHRAGRLQAVVGWSDLTTAQKYSRRSGTAPPDLLRPVHHW